MLYIIVGVGIVTLVVVLKYFRKPHDPMEVELGDLDPRETIEDYYFLSQNGVTWSDENPRGMHSHKHPTSPISEGSDKLSCLSDSEPDVVCKKTLDFTTTSPTRK